MGKRIIVSGIIALVIVYVMFEYSPTYTAARNGEICEENYKKLEKLAVDIAKGGENYELDNQTTVNQIIKNDKLIINVGKTRYQVEAEIPIEGAEIRYENDKISYTGDIDYNRIKYSRHTDVMPLAFYYGLGIVFFVILMGIFYILLDKIKKLTSNKNPSVS